MGRDIYGKPSDLSEEFLEKVAQTTAEGIPQEKIAVGERIKKLRKEKNLSLQDLADKTGFSTALLSQLENHLVSPPLGTLIRLAKGLEVNLGELIFGQGEKTFSIVRSKERKVVSRYASKVGVSYGYTYEALAPDFKGGHMVPFMVTLEPTETPKKPSSHDGEEFITVLEGEMEITLEEFTDVLQPGDCVYYHSTIPHLARCHKGKPARILAVIYPGN
jgi:transcriptional regulator with XRE-family HTH domain